MSEWPLRVGGFASVSNAASVVLRAALLAVLFPGMASAEPIRGESVGYYSNGTLTGGQAVPANGPNHYLIFPAPCYRKRPLGPAYPDKSRADNFFGHPNTVAAVLDAAKLTRARYPKAPRVPVGELSNRVGSSIRRHLSHQNGLDVDVYFLREPDGPGKLPVPHCQDGPSYEAKSSRGVWQVTPDFRRDWNWALITAFALRHDVKRIFIGGLLKQELGRWARANKVPKRERKRTMAKLHAVLCRPPKGRNINSYRGNFCPHDDHIHVRFRCPKGSGRCRSSR